MQGRKTIVKQLVFLLLLCSSLVAAEELQRYKKLDGMIVKLTELKGAHRYNEALEISRQAIEESLKIASTQNKDMSSYLVPLYFVSAELYLQRGEKEKALHALEQMASMDVRLMPPNQYPNLLMLFHSLAQQDQNARKYTRALLFEQSALKLSALCHGEEGPEYAILTSNLGSIYYDMGGYDKALQYGESAFRIVKQKSFKEDQDFVTIAMNLGSYYMAAGRYEEAGSLHDQNFVHRAENCFGRSGALASVYNTVGVTSLKLGEYPQAKSYFESALQIKDTLRQYDSSRVKIEMHLGHLYRQLGNTRKSIGYYTDALQTYRTWGVEDRELLGAVYFHLALAHIAQSEWKSALGDLKRSMQIWDKEHPDRAYLYSQLGDVYIAMKQYPQALEALLKAVHMKQKYFGEDHPSLATTYINLSNLYAFNGDEKKSLAYSQKALGLLQAQRLTDNYMLETLYANIAASYSASNEEEKAYLAINQSFEAFKRAKKEAFGMTSQREKRYFRDAYYDAMDHYLKFSYVYLSGLREKECKRETIKVFESLIGMKRAISREFLQMRYMAEINGNARFVKAFERVQKNRCLIAALFRQNGTEEASLIEPRMERLQAMIDKDEAVLSRALGERSNESAKVTFETLLSEIGENAYYLDFIRTQTYYYRFLIGSDGEITLHRFSRTETQRIDALVEEIRRENASIAQRETFADIQKAYLLYGELYALLFEGVMLENVHNLSISSDGALHYLAFEALWDKERQRYLIQDHTVHYLLSPAGLDGTRDRKDLRPFTVTVFADPEFGGSDLPTTKREGDLARSGYSPLPGTAQEARAVASLFEGATLYLGKNATAGNLLGVHPPTILHIATHGFASKAVYDETALLKSGLVFSGANEANATAAIVNALEISAMDLNETELVTLSSCYSGSGALDRMEGIAGLGEAFHEAGAKRVLASLWAVEDSVSQTMITDFYREVKRHGDYTQALRDTKLRQIEKGISHPYYWANYLLYGGE